MAGTATAASSSSSSSSSEPAPAPFPWHLGVYDAHCHPLERIPSFSAAPTMKTRVSAVMATRYEDQELMHEAALRHGGPRGSTTLTDRTKIVAGFGWHPWFSHQLYDDTLEAAGSDAAVRPRGNEGEEEEGEEEEKALKLAHYSAVLTPTPDPSFCLALEAPHRLSLHLRALRAHLAAHPLALVGEVGLDRSFRLPAPWTPELRAARPGGAAGDPARTPGARERRPLSAQRVGAAHQRAVLRAQLRVAAEAGRAVSVHGVQAHGALFDEFRALWSEEGPRGGAGGGAEGEAEREGEGEESEAGAGGGKKRRGGRASRKKDAQPRGRFPPRICLHSYSGSVEALKPWFARSTPAAVYVSLSTTNNFRSCFRPSVPGEAPPARGAGDLAAEERAAAVARWCPADRLLVESDLHILGQRADDALEGAVRRVCALRGWGLEDGVRQLGRNFREFILGPEAVAAEENAAEFAERSGTVERVVEKSEMVEKLEMAGNSVAEMSDEAVEAEAEVNR
jgi:Tat protein secretion system quality control protein TatD with DNase activity